MRLTKRVIDLEAKRSRADSALDHLTDEELEAYALDVIGQFAAAGVVLPDDWRARYDHSAIRFLQWLEGEAREKLTCET